MKKIPCSSLIFLLIFLCSCARFDSPKETIIFSEQTQCANIAKGDTFVIALEGNPTTGYIWTYKLPAPKEVKLITEHYQAKEKNIGSGGTYFFSFKAEQCGKYSLDFEYLRSWEKKAIKTKSIILTVENK